MTPTYNSLFYCEIQYQRCQNTVIVFFCYNIQPVLLFPSFNCSVILCFLVLEGEWLRNMAQSGEAYKEGGDSLTFFLNFLNFNFLTLLLQRMFPFGSKSLQATHFKDYKLLLSPSKLLRDLNSSIGCLVGPTYHASI